MNKEELKKEVRSIIDRYYSTGSYNELVEDLTQFVYDFNEIPQDTAKVRKQLVPKDVANMLDDWNKFGVDAHSVVVTYHDWYYSFPSEGDESPRVAWALANPTALMKAWVNGYEVEKEPLYTVTINLNIKYHLVIDEGDGDDEIITTLTTTDNVFGYRYFLTEKEIKSAGDNLWAFAVPVDEVVEG